MANPNWQIGMKAVNAQGRPKNSVTTVRGMVERFVKRNITPNRLQKMYNALTELQKMQMLQELLPYVIARRPAETLDESMINDLYKRLKEVTPQSVAV